MIIDAVQSSQIRSLIKKIYESGRIEQNRHLLLKIINTINSSDNSAAFKAELLVAYNLIRGKIDYSTHLHARRFIVQDLKCDQTKWPTENILISSTGQAGTRTTSKFLCFYFNGHADRLDEVGIGNLGGYSPRLAPKLFSKDRLIFTVHCPAWPDLIYNVSRSKTKTLFLTRNIFELLSSYATKQQNPYVPDNQGVLSQNFHVAKGMNYCPFYFTEDPGQLDSIKWKTILIHGYILVDMIATWFHKKGALGFEIFDLKEQKNDERKFFTDILSSLGVEIDQAQFEQAFLALQKEKESSPVNLALEPEGKKRIPKFEFTQIQKGVIRQLYNAYPDIDFSIVDDGI